MHVATSEAQCLADRVQIGSDVTDLSIPGSYAKLSVQTLLYKWRPPIFHSFYRPFREKQDAERSVRHSLSGRASRQLCVLLVQRRGEPLPTLPHRRRFRGAARHSFGGRIRIVRSPCGASEGERQSAHLALCGVDDGVLFAAGRGRERGGGGDGFGVEFEECDAGVCAHDDELGLERVNLHGVDLQRGGNKKRFLSNNYRRDHYEDEDDGG